MPDRKPFFAPLAHQTYRNIWFASLASNLGGLIQGVGAAWMMTSISTSENMVALVQASTTLPIMLFSLISGAIADNFDRRRVMMTAQLFMFSVSALLAAFAYLGWMTPWALLTFTFLIGCGTALNNPSWQASVGDMVPRDDLAGAVSLNSMGFNITRSVGPALGGLIVAVGGGAAAFATNALSYLAIIAALLGWKREAADNAMPREQIGSAVAAGFRYAAMSPNLLKVFARSFLFGLSSVAILALLPVVARDIIQGGPLTFGLMLGAFGVGAIGGAYISAWLRERLSSEDIVRCAFAGFAVSEAIIGASTSGLLDGLALMLAGAFWVIALSLFNTIVQLSTPRWVVGRALSFYQTAAFGGMAAGSWLWGAIAESSNVSLAFFIAATVMAAGVVVGLFLPMPAFASLDLDPLNRFRQPNLKLNILPRSGPLVVQVAYNIHDDDLETFLALMTERRRIRIRDGARNWALMRDLEVPELWTETYHVPTWVDYVRHVQRRTQADADNIDQLWALHRGEGPPKVCRMIERQTIRLEDDIFHQHHHHHIGPGPH
ncbi:MFS transporter [Rhizobium sp. L1K21]|uniref:MFS transporter n=1 Tax=Rhizobium sp. L1K21 TaxID=2954933 RepID=UPI002092FC92|nr:MFS transporter [Rhizobium sp. L1K21]MCO6184780.1 MFS transporter [Rhizobium sp. L1K21]